MKRNYIGIANSFHDSSVSIVNSEGKVVYAEAAERYLQNKRAINHTGDCFIRIAKLVQQYCEPGAEIVVANSWSEECFAAVEDAKKNYETEMNAWKDSEGNIPELILDKMAFREFSLNSQMNALNLTDYTLKYEISQLDEWKKYTDFEIRRYNHHFSHAATAIYTAPYKEGVCAIIDGYGEKCSSQSFTFKNGEINPIANENQINFMGGSLGIFYQIVCDVCGFGYFRGEEWKVMGLAAYGKFDEKYYKIMKSMLCVKGLDIVPCNSLKYNQCLRKLYSFKRKDGQPAIEYADFAYTGQVVFQELLYEYLTNLYNKTGCDHVVLGGGAFLNSWANGEITEKTPFESCHIYSAPGDDGNSLGAALLAYREDHPEWEPSGTYHTPYLGSEITADSIDKFMKFSGMQKYVKKYDNVCQKAAELLAEGKIIGWVQGKAEFGPRALGNRSILADARAKDCKDRINMKVKFREEFRPFAPSVLDEYGADYFENYMPTPYMERTLRFKPEVVDKVPGVVHENKTGRLQSVRREWNEKYYDLIKAFYEITGVPLVLNTSFNVMGKPIIHSFEDALAVFFTSGLDAMIFNDYVMIKPDSAE